VLKLVEPRGHLVYNLRYNFRRAPAEGLQNGRFDYADPLQLRQRVARFKNVTRAVGTAARSPTAIGAPLTFRHCDGMTEGRLGCRS